MIQIKENELLKNHSTFHIGGPAKYFVVAQNPDDILEALNWAKDNNVIFKVIGGGSNVLFSDNGFDGLVIKYFGGEIKLDGEIMKVGAGVLLAQAINFALDHNLLGLEWAVGIPGTIGGAVHNNSGAYGGEIADSVISVEVLTGGVTKKISQDDCDFSYRESRFKKEPSQDIILSADLQLKAVSEEELIGAKEKMQANQNDRDGKSAEGGSAGSTFRNIVLSEEEAIKFKEKFPEFPDKFVQYQKVPAAWLIEQCGLKGRKIGGAMVSQKHAGKVTNIGEATAEDVIMLISIIKQKVRTKFNLQLMEEIEYVGF